MEILYTHSKKPTHEIKRITLLKMNFLIDLDNIFKHYLSDDARDKNELILDMFLTAIPIIESFAKSYLINNKHTLHKIQKKIFNQLYKDAEDCEEKLIKDNVSLRNFFRLCKNN